jgi:hypothetical protein
MEGSRQKSSIIGQFILDNVSLHPTDIVKITAQRFAISRQAAARHLKKLVSQGNIETEGNTSGRIYRPTQGQTVEFSYAIADRPEGNAVWRKDILPLLQSFPDNVINLWNYCFQGIFDNGCTHSSGTMVHVQIIQQKTQTTINITDDGDGLFHNIQAKFRLKDEQDAALKLAEGELADDPEDHTGMDINSSSRMTDHFTIISGNVTFAHQYGIAWDWALSMSGEKKNGTVVSMIIDNDTSRTTSQVFNDYSTPAAASDIFSKTCIPVRLAKYSTETLFSRSQARRVLTRVERFNFAVLDFLGVNKIGPAFADQIFRVFSSEHPEIQVLHCNTNKQVEAVIQEAKDNSTRAIRNRR